MLFALMNTVKIFSFCLKNFPCVTTKFPVFSLSGKGKNQIPCFLCSMATLMKMETCDENQRLLNLGEAGQIEPMDASQI